MEALLEGLAGKLNLNGLGDVCLLIALWCLMLTVKQISLHLSVKRLQNKQD